MELLEGGKNYEMNPSESYITSGMFLEGMPRILDPSSLFASVLIKSELNYTKYFHHDTLSQYTPETNKTLQSLTKTVRLIFSF